MVTNPKTNACKRRPQYSKIHGLVILVYTFFITPLTMEPTRNTTNPPPFQARCVHFLRGRIMFLLRRKQYDCSPQCFCWYQMCLKSFIRCQPPPAGKEFREQPGQEYQVPSTLNRSIEAQVPCIRVPTCF